MKTLRFEKNPGYLVDIFSLFVLYFNREEYLRQNANRNRMEVDAKYFDSVLRSAGSVPEELSLFFRMDGVNDCLLVENFLLDGKRVCKDADPDGLLKKFSDRDDMIRRVTRFYFGKKKQFPAYGDPSFLQTVSAELRASRLSAELKNYLYAFFLEPEDVLSLLTSAWKTAEAAVSRMYKAARDGIAQVRSDLDRDTLCDCLAVVEGKKPDLPEDAIVTVCVLNKNILRRTATTDGTTVVLVGTDYLSYLDYLKDRNSGPELGLIGEALGEKNRIQILDLILEHGERSVADLKQSLALSHTNAYYHISLLQRAGLVTCRNEGRMIYYRLNPIRFEEACTLMLKYRNAGK